MCVCWYMPKALPPAPLCMRCSKAKVVHCSSLVPVPPASSGADGDHRDAHELYSDDARTPTSHPGNVKVTTALTLIEQESLWRAWGSPWGSPWSLAPHSIPAPSSHCPQEAVRVPPAHSIPAPGLHSWGQHGEQCVHHCWSHVTVRDQGWVGKGDKTTIVRWEGL